MGPSTWKGLEAFLRTAFDRDGVIIYELVDFNGRGAAGDSEQISSR